MLGASFWHALVGAGDAGLSREEGLPRVRAALRRDRLRWRIADTWRGERFA